MNNLQSENASLWYNEVSADKVIWSLVFLLNTLEKFLQQSFYDIMIGFLTNPGSSLIRSLKSDPHPAFRSSCPFVFRLLRKNLVNPSIESYPARQRSAEHTSELQSRG